MDSDGKYYYFDQDGMVVDVEEAPVDGIPLVDGMDPDELKLYHKLKKKSSSLKLQNKKMIYYKKK